tara:strand:+ start:2155 stop:2460 length:306 start_codon:yes stop_codon:yes gene_type:complete
MNDETKALLLSRDVGTLLMNINRRAKSALHQYAQENDYDRYTIQDAASERGESPQLMWRTMRYWEQSNPTLLSLARLAYVLRVKFTWLLSGDPQKVEWEQD